MIKRSDRWFICAYPSIVQGEPPPSALVDCARLKRSRGVINIQVTRQTVRSVQKRRTALARHSAACATTVIAVPSSQQGNPAKARPIEDGAERDGSASANAAAASELTANPASNNSADNPSLQNTYETLCNVPCTKSLNRRGSEATTWNAPTTLPTGSAAPVSPANP